MVRAYCTQHTQHIQLPTMDALRMRWACTVGSANWAKLSAHPPTATLRRSVQILNPRCAWGTSCPNP